MSKAFWTDYVVPVVIASIGPVFLLLVLGGFVTSCDENIIRDRQVYETELDFFEKVSIDEADLLNRMVQEHCTCVDGKFENLNCQESAEAVVVVRARLPWHKEMSRYNAGLTSTRPSEEPPAIPPATSLCPKR